MMSEQLIPAFISSLLLEGVDPLLIERAVARVRDIKLGESISGSNPLHRSFAMEQADLLKRALH